MISLCLLVACLAADGAPPPIAPDYLLDSTPPLGDVEVKNVFSELYLPLWLQALERPEADYQRLAAESVAQAHRVGAAKMAEARPALLRILTKDDSHPAARFTAARALIVLDTKEAAPQLWEAAQNHGFELRTLVEPAIAKWNHPPAYEIWRKRLASDDTSHRDLVLAIRCLGDGGDQSSLPVLLAAVHDKTRGDEERLAAARSAARLKDSGLEMDAQKLSQPGGKIIDRLCAATLLQRHSGAPAQKELLALAVDAEPGVATLALARLNALDFALVLPLAEKAMQSADSGVRREGARAYAALPTKERIEFLGKLLDDPAPRVRILVREEFRRLAVDSAWNDAVRQAATAALNGESWRGQEQGALLLAALDHKPAAPRLVTLLDSPRAEVMEATAWGLRKLAVPDTLPALLKKATELTEIRIRQNRNFESLDKPTAHLLEAFGQMHYEPAESLLKRYVPKDYIMGELSRGSAIWSLGQLHIGKPDDALAAAIAGRVTEPSMAMPPEMHRVRMAGAIALGFMKNKTQAEAIRKYTLAADNKTFMAIRWALNEMTGEQLPARPPVIISKSGWFLEPLEAPPVAAE